MKETINRFVVIAFISFMVLQVTCAQETNENTAQLETAELAVMETNETSSRTWFGVSASSHYFVFPSFNVNFGVDNVFDSIIDIHANLDWMFLASGFELGVDAVITIDVDDNGSQIYAGVGPRLLGIFDEELGFENTIMPGYGFVVGNNFQGIDNNSNSALFIESDISFPFGFDVPFITMTTGYKF